MLSKEIHPLRLERIDLDGPRRGNSRIAPTAEGFEVRSLSEDISPRADDVGSRIQVLERLIESLERAVDKPQPKAKFNIVGSARRQTFAGLDSEIVFAGGA